MKTLPLAGVIIPGEAMFTQPEIGRVISKGRGDCVFAGKDKQPALKAGVTLAFGPDWPLGGRLSAL